MDDAIALSVYETVHYVAHHGSLLDPVPTVWSQIPPMIAKAVRLAGVGIAMGLAFGWAMHQCLHFLRLRGAKTHMEVAIILGGSYLAFYVANAPAGGSGVFALVVFGLYGSATSHWGLLSRAVAGGEYMAIWDTIAEMANAIAFGWGGIVGMTYLIRSARLLKHAPAVAFWGIPIVYVFMLIIRAGFLLIMRPVFAFLGEPVSPREVVFLTFSGLRGTMTIIMLANTVQGSPTAVGDVSDPNNPYDYLNQRTATLTLWGCCYVIMTLCINAPLLAPLLRLLGLTEVSDSRRKAQARAKARLVEHGHEAVARLRARDAEFLRGANWDAVLQYIDCSNDLSQYDDPEVPLLRPGDGQGDAHEAASQRAELEVPLSSGVIEPLGSINAGGGLDHADLEAGAGTAKGGPNASASGFGSANVSTIPGLGAPVHIPEHSFNAAAAAAAAGKLGSIDGSPLGGGEGGGGGDDAAPGVPGDAPPPASVSPVATRLPGTASIELSSLQHGASHASRSGSEAWGLERPSIDYNNQPTATVAMPSFNTSGVSATHNRAALVQFTGLSPALPHPMSLPAVGSIERTAPTGGNPARRAGGAPTPLSEWLRRTTAAPAGALGGGRDGDQVEDAGMGVDFGDAGRRAPGAWHLPLHPSHAGDHHLDAGAGADAGGQAAAAAQPAALALARTSPFVRLPEVAEEEEAAVAAFGTDGEPGTERDEGEGPDEPSSQVELVDQRERVMASVQRRLHDRRTQAGLSARAMRVLTYACEQCLEPHRLTRPLHAWRRLERDVADSRLGRVEARLLRAVNDLMVRTPRALQVTLLSPLLLLRRKLRSLLGARALLACEVSMEYYLALREVPRLEWAHAGDGMLPEIQAEVHAEMLRSYRFVLDREIEAPETFGAILSYRAAMAALDEQLAFVDDLFASGWATEAQRDAMAECLEMKLVRLELRGPVWRPPQPSSLLQGLALFEGVSTPFFYALARRGSLREHPSGEKFWQAHGGRGGIATPVEGPGLYVVVLGGVQQVHVALDDSRQDYYQGAGGVIGSLRALSGAALAGTQEAVARGSSLGRGPTLFHLPQPVVADALAAAAQGHPDALAFELGVARVAASGVIISMPNEISKAIRAENARRKSRAPTVAPPESSFGRSPWESVLAAVPSPFETPGGGRTTVGGLSRAPSLGASSIASLQMHAAVERVAQAAALANAAVAVSHAAPAPGPGAGVPTPSPPPEGSAGAGFGAGAASEQVRPSVTRQSSARSQASATPVAPHLANVLSELGPLVTLEEEELTSDVERDSLIDPHSPRSTAAHDDALSLRYVPRVTGSTGVSRQGSGTLAPLVLDLDAVASEADATDSAIGPGSVVGAPGPAASAAPGSAAVPPSPSALSPTARAPRPASSSSEGALTNGRPTSSAAGEISAAPAGGLPAAREPAAPTPIGAGLAGLPAGASPLPSRAVTPMGRGGGLGGFASRTVTIQDGMPASRATTPGLTDRAPSVAGSVKPSPRPVRLPGLSSAPSRAGSASEMPADYLARSVDGVCDAYAAGMPFAQLLRLQPGAVLSLDEHAVLLGGSLTAGRRNFSAPYPLVCLGGLAVSWTAGSDGAVLLVVPRLEDAIAD